MRPARGLVALMAAPAMVAMAGVGMAVAPAAAVEDEATRIDVLSINDFHGRLEADGQAAGAAVLSGAVKKLRGENPNTVFAAAGDLIGASTFTSFIQQDNPTIDALNEAGLEVSAVGNHEFDAGYEDLLNRVIPRAEWKYLGANVKVKAAERDKFADLTESWVKTVDGVNVGFVGAVTEHLNELVTPAGIAMLDVLDPITAANDVADQMKAEGAADIVVLLVHEGAATTAIESATDPDSDFGKIVNGATDNFDAIISGHTHLAYQHMIPVPGWAAEGRPLTARPVVSAGQYGYMLNKVSFTYDKNAKVVTAVDSEILPLTVRNADNKWVPNPEYPSDPAVQEIVDQAVAVAAVEGARKLGEITADFNRARQSDPAKENRGGESTLGNLVADAQLAGAKVTDPATEIAFMNPGGLRQDMKYSGADKEDGVVTYKEAAEVQPFANTLVTMTLTGEQIVKVLEEQWQPEGASRPFLKLGVSKGFFYTYDPAAPKGDHITGAWLNGEQLDPAKDYRVVVNSFLASGGDNFGTLAEGKDAKDSGQIDLQSMVAYLGENSPVSPDLAQRAVGVHFEAPADGFKAGDLVTVELSSLLFSTNEPKDEKVVAKLAGEDVGVFEVDPTVIDTTDEVGRATVSFELPGDLAGYEPAHAALDITGATTGTTLSVQIPVAGTAPMPTCTSTVSGDHNGPLVVSSGATCVTGANISGPINVKKGGTLYVADAELSGPITAHGAAAVTLLDSTVWGAVTINGTTGAVVVAGSTIDGPLVCQRNATMPSDVGHPNEVEGTKVGQCAAL